jgi:hypothetical protein
MYENLNVCLISLCTIELEMQIHNHFNEIVIDKSFGLIEQIISVFDFVLRPTKFRIFFFEFSKFTRLEQNPRYVIIFLIQFSFAFQQN